MSTENSMGKPRGYIICAALGLVLGLAAGAFGGYSYGRSGVRVQAIKTGHAIYKVVDEHGNTQFEWLPGDVKPAAGDGKAAPK